MNLDDEDDDVREMVRRAALSIDVQDREQQILGRDSGTRERFRVRLIPLAVAAAIGGILVAVAIIRAGGGPTDSSPATGPVSASTRQGLPSTSSSASASTGLAVVSEGVADDGWTTGAELVSAVKDGVPVSELQKVAARTAQLLQAGDVQGLLGLQRPDMARSDLTAELVDDLGGHPSRANIYFDANQPGDQFAGVAIGVDCQASGLRASVTLKYGLHEGVWYLNLAAGFGGIMTQEGETPTGSPPSNSQELSCGGSK